MKQTLIAVAIAVLGASAALANPSLDSSPNRVWRNAPESTAAQTESEGVKFESPYEQLNGNFVN